MKKIIASALLTASLITASVASVFAVETGTAYGEVPKTSDTITIDGEMDKIYEQGLVIKSLEKDEKGNDASGTFTAYLLWNGTDTLYCWADIVDPTFYEAPADAQAWNTDSLELFLDYSNTTERNRDQYRVDNKGVATYYDTTTLTNEECLPYGFTGYAAKETDTGYSVEFSIKAYKEEISDNMKVGFHLMLNDMVDANTRNNIHSDACGNNPSSFGYITLSANAVTAVVADTTATPDTTTTTDDSKAPATFDVSVVLAAVAAVAGTGAVIFKKKH